MKIIDVNVFPFLAKRVYSTTTSSLGGVPNIEGGVAYSKFAVIELISDTGTRGYGEVSDIPDTSTQETALRMPSGEDYKAELLAKYLADQLIGKDPFKMDELLEVYPISPMVDIRSDGTIYDIVGCGVENALLDLVGRTLGIPVYNLFGGKKKDKIWVSWGVFIREIKYSELEVAEKVAEGFNAYKIKVGINAKEDEERLRMVREVAGDNAVIKLDANSGWTYDEAVKNLKILEKYNPAGIETPIPYLDVEGKARLRKHIGIPILEHVNTMDYALELIKHNAVDVFNVCTTGAGGVKKAQKILTLAESAGIPCLLGSTVESGLGTASQLHLAASSSLITWPSDLVGPKMYANDILKAPLVWEQGYLVVPEGSGWGVEVDFESLKLY